MNPIDGRILVVDTATTRAVVALGQPDGRVIEARAWTAGYRHGEELLTRIEDLLRDADLTSASLGAIVVGTGPGGFTGLRVGLATVKGLAHALALPVVGVATSAALLHAAAELVGASAPPGVGRDATLALLLPAGPSDRLVCRAGEPARIVRPGTEADAREGELLVAVDLDGRAPADAVARGDAARARLGAALLALGAPRLARGEGDDLARLVPEYVTLPRGVHAAADDAGVALTGATGDGRPATTHRAATHGAATR